jgi:hypothetical protein
VPRQTGKGSSKRREAAFERKAMQHHDFIGQSETERAEAEFRKQERLAGQRADDTVHAMAEKLEELAEKDQAGLRLPRSVAEGKQLLREGPEALREKARERLAQLPEPARNLVQRAEDIAALLFAPVRIGWAVAREIVRFPVGMLRALREREV